MKLLFRLLLLLSIVIETSCSNSNDKNEESILKINCFEFVGDFPSLKVNSSDYYGRLYLGLTFDSTKNTFEKYSIIRSTLYTKSNSSVFSTYDSDEPKSPAPDIYKQIVKEIKSRVDSSGIIMQRKKDIERCTEINWVILRVDVE